ncbi:MAG: ABC transporter ATP-binding protein [Acidimicrobiales bacterium]
MSQDSPLQPTVELSGVTHRFGDVTALDDLTFSVPAQQITVLLGPNGAGKTTAIRAITGALSPATGEISVFGTDPRREGDHVRPRCGVVSAKPALYDRLSGYDNLLYSAQLYGMSTRDVAGPIHAAAARFGIDEALDQQVGGYSTGMKTRLALARSVLHDPDLLLFDEPTSGLDPESSQAVLDLIREMTHDGKTVVMCTHLLAEAEGLADHVVVMEAGTALCTGSAEELTARYWPTAVLFLNAESPDQLDRVAGWHGVVGYERSPEGARIELDGFGRVPGLVLDLALDGVRITRVDPRVPTLEDLYFAVRRERAGAPPLGSSARPTNENGSPHRGTREQRTVSA